jgi:hypothetical protein
VKKKPTGTIVMELNHSGIPDDQLQPEEFDDLQKAVLTALQPEHQEKIRKGCPYAVSDLETGRSVKFNQHNVKPSETQMRMLGRALLDSYREWIKDPENQKKMEEYKTKNAEKTGGK